MSEPRLHLGDQVTIEPSELVAGGASIARVDGLPVFATGVYPGDRAIVRVIERKKGFARAELVRLLVPSPLRRVAPCPVAEDCGGCDWTSLRLDAQLAAKQRILTESLRRIGKIDLATLPPIALHPSPLNYRLRSRLHRDGNTIGFYAPRTNRVVPLAHECEVVGLETARRFGASNAAHRDNAPGRTSARDEYSDAEHAADDHVAPDELWEPGMLAVSDPNGHEPIVSGDCELTLTVDRFSYRLSTRSFFQVNRHLLGTMLRLVSAHAASVGSRVRAVDLYAGVGFFTAPLAELFGDVTAVEGSPVSHRYAKANAAKNVTLVQAAVESWATTMDGADLVFLDPPRAGARPEVIDAVALHTREKVCYLSCDPVTFSRDASRLIASGWRLLTLDLLDLFPNTHHVETLSSFERAR